MIRYHKIRLNKQSRLDLKAWTEYINNFYGKLIFWKRFGMIKKLQMYTDAACILGYGAVLVQNGLMASGLI